jgi:hypothetical protein
MFGTNTHTAESATMMPTWATKPSLLLLMILIA